MLIAVLEDTAFRRRKKALYQRRWTVRAFAYNEEGKLAFLRIKGVDEFGKRNHLETLGGAVENEESLEEAIIRSVREEIGYECDVIEELGYIVDHYNLINRETISTYFIIKLTKYVGGECLSEFESSLFSGVEYLDSSDVRNELMRCERHSINELVQRRDRIAYEYYLKHPK